MFILHKPVDSRTETFADITHRCVLVETHIDYVQLVYKPVDSRTETFADITHRCVLVETDIDYVRFVLIDFIKTFSTVH